VLVIVLVIDFLITSMSTSMTKRQMRDLSRSGDNA
jgi:hypothetical protein